MAYPCQACDRVYKHKGGLTVHIQDKHEGGQGSHMCPQCGGGYASKTSLDEHIKRMHEGRKRHSCNLCGQAFFAPKDVATPLRIHHTHEKPFVCNICQVSYPTPRQVRAHRFNHMDTKPFACTHCDKTFLSRYNLTIHSQTHTRHTGETPFPCHECGKRFHSRQALKKHTFWYAEVKGHSCTYCSYKCRTSGELELHLRVHTGEKPYKCEECNTFYARTTHLRKHRARWHNTDRPVHVCDYCGKQFLLLQSMNAHVNREHLKTPSVQVKKQTRPVGEKLVCSFCEKCFTNQGNLNAYIKLHTGEKIFSCRVCGKQSATRSQSKAHEKIHQAWFDRQAKCGICDKKFSNSVSLRKHRQSEHRDQLFSCHVCTMCYTTTTALGRHLKTHTGEKPFSCGVCGKAFHYRWNLKTHEKTHQSDRTKFGCKWCSSSFTGKAYLRKHSAKCKQAPKYKESLSRKISEVIRRNRAAGKDPFFCDTCAKPLRSKEVLGMHLETHAVHEPTSLMHIARNTAIIVQPKPQAESTISTSRIYEVRVVLQPPAFVIAVTTKEARLVGNWAKFGRIGAEGGAAAAGA